MTMQEIGGINARLFCPVLAIHEAELIGYEMGLWTVAQPLLGDCLRTWGFSDGGANSVLMTTHFYDRKHMFNEVEARSPSRHGPIVQHLEAQVQSRFPAARFERTWISREHPWFSKADRGAAHAKHFTQRNRPIWLHQLYGAIGDVQPLLFYFTYPDWRLRFAPPPQISTGQAEDIWEGRTVDRRRPWQKWLSLKKQR